MPLPPPPAPEPAMPAAQDAQLTLFGELPELARLPFHPRAHAPMKQHSIAAEGADFDVDVSPDARHLVFASTRHSTQSDLYIKAVDGVAVTQVTSDPAPDVQPCFSPDGRSIAFASSRSGNWDLWVIGTDNGQATQLTRSPWHEIHPSFSPDGRHLAYCMFNVRAEQWELWVLQLDRPDARRMIGVGLFPRWGPRGDSILYQRARQRGGRWFSIWRIDLGEGEPGFPVELAASAQMALIQPTWSPDGEWVAYGTVLPQPLAVDPAAGALPPTSRGDIWVMRADGTGARQLTDGQGAHFGPCWAADGRVYFTSLQSHSENIWSVQATEPAMTQTPVAAEDNTALPAGASSVVLPAVGGQGG
ncbi:MAG: DPP IV N-terminal domain-containing protein [Phycisphaerae bacterium]|nr:DPP IV N-terminal domain-containing protein [Phycisphaerae bacterium]